MFAFCFLISNTFGQIFVSDKMDLNIASKGNSLLDCVVFGRVAGKHAVQRILGNGVTSVDLKALSSGQKVACAGEWSQGLHHQPGHCGWWWSCWRVGHCQGVAGPCQDCTDLDVFQFILEFTQVCRSTMLYNKEYERTRLS